MFAAHLAVGAVPRLVPQVDPDVVPVSDDVTRQAVAAGHAGAVGGGGAGHHHPHVPLWGDQVREESHTSLVTHRPWSEPLLLLPTGTGLSSDGETSKLCTLQYSTLQYTVQT